MPYQVPSESIVGAGIGTGGVRGSGIVKQRLGGVNGYAVLGVVALTTWAALAGPRSARGAGADPPDPYTAVCTTGMVAEIARNVAGSHARVVQLMGEGVDPHLYKVSPGDVRALSDADIIFYNGLMLEGKMSDVLVKMARKRPVYAVGEGIAESRLREPPEFAGHYDPHVWFDVSMWSECVEQAREVLIEFDAAHADDYRSAAAAYLQQLAELHEYARRQIATIPEDRRVLVTAHDAFGYFGRAYGMEVRGIQGISTESEASIKDVNDLIGFLCERKVKAVFVETSVPERNVRALVEGCRARGHGITVGGELFSDAMGKEGTPSGTYVGMVRHNVDTIVKALR
jgi:manganese/zinc/iron transport system substrate-binding protein